MIVGGCDGWKDRGSDVLFGRHIVCRMRTTRWSAEKKANQSDVSIIGLQTTKHVYVIVFKPIFLICNFLKEYFAKC